MNSIDCPLQLNARILPDHDAIICGEKKYTYQQFNQAVWRIADYLKELGIQENDRVAILAPNSADYLIALYALWRLKTLPCLLSTRLPEETLNEQLHMIGCRYLITPIASVLESPKVQIKKINLTQAIDQRRADLKNIDKKIISFTLNQDATVIYTSGSSGTPKAALHTFGNHFFNAKGSNEQIPFAPEDRWMLSLPLYHVGGLAILFRVLLGKGSIIIPESGKETEQTIQEHGVTHLSLVSTQLFRLLNKGEGESLKTLKAILLGGGAVPATLIEKAVGHQLPLHLSYGLTEAASQVATSARISNAQQPEKARILNDRQVRISDHNEIHVKGKTLFKGYLTSNGLETPVDPEGWFATGDLGSITDEKFLTVTGRKDNMFISGGENIRPEEIERHLCRLDGVEQAVVIPIEHQEYGFRPIAFIKFRPETAIDKTEILNMLHRHLPKFMTPDKFYILPSSNDAGGIKISRLRLMKLLAEDNPALTPIQ